MVVRLVSSGFNEISSLLTPLEKSFWLPLEKFTIAHPPGKNPSDGHAHKNSNWTLFRAVPRNYTAKCILNWCHFGAIRKRNMRFNPKRANDDRFPQQEQRHSDVYFQTGTRGARRQQTNAPWRSWWSAWGLRRVFSKCCCSGFRGWPRSWSGIKKKTWVRLVCASLPWRSEREKLPRKYFVTLLTTSSAPWERASSPQPPRQEAQFRLRPATHCRHQN